MLASGLFGSPAGIVSSDVALDSADPIVGSFTTDGLTYAVGTDGLTLVAVAPDAAADGAASIPDSVTYNGTTYSVTAVGPYAFYLSGATVVALPDSVASVNDRAFRSSDVARVEVAADNPNIASFDGCLYDSQLTSLLLIPEGRAGAVLLPETAEVVEPSKFSHCSLVDAISVEEGGADFASWDGLLYSADGATLLRVPAGATEITIRDGCTTIAAGALEGCANLERIYSPVSVTSISPDLFESVPTVVLPAQTAVQDEASSGVASGLPDQVNDSTDFIPQLTAMVALSTTDDGLPEIIPSDITVLNVTQTEGLIWQEHGFMTAQRNEQKEIDSAPVASLEAAKTYSVYPSRIYSNGHKVKWTQQAHLPDGTFQYSASGIIRGDSGAYLDNNSEVEFYHILETDSRPEKRTQVLRWNYGNRGNTNVIRYFADFSSGEPGWSIKGFGTTATATQGVAPITNAYKASAFYALWRAHVYTIILDSSGGNAIENVRATYDQDAMLSTPVRAGYGFLGWNTMPDGSGTTYQPGTVRNLTADDGATVTLYAQWKPYEISFDTDSEPDDADYPSEPKDSVSGDAAGPDGTIAIEDPKRPGYVFEGWVIPNGDGTEAVDQELVYQGDDGKWYVDASQLPDYAGDDGRVELTARWTSVISVDVPSSVTFYADLVTQGQQSREGAASSAFGQSKVANQSQVDLRVVGLESSAVKTDGSTLGADSILKKADAATPSASAGKLLSLYPSTKQWTADELRDPDAVGGNKPASVDFDLDDILLEKSFTSGDLPADAFTIAAGDTLNMGYRLNLSETGQQLDYDKLSTLQEGQSASIANVSYCFAADYGMSFWTLDDDGSTLNVFAIKADAEKIAAGDAAIAAKYTAWMNADHRFYVKWYDQGVAETDDPTKATVYDVRIIGLNHDDKSDGSGKAGITFQLVDCLDAAYPMNGTASTSGGWAACTLHALMNDADGAIYRQAPATLRSVVAPVLKQSGTASGSSAMATTSDSLFLLSQREVYGDSTGSWTEGRQYPFYSGVYFTPDGNVRQPRLLKQRAGAAEEWLHRTILGATRYKSVSKGGICVRDGEGGSMGSNDMAGASLAFCL